MKRRRFIVKVGGMLTAVGAARVVDARLEGVAASCGTWRGSPVCVHGRLAP